MANDNFSWTFPDLDQDPDEESGPDVAAEREAAFNLKMAELERIKEEYRKNVEFSNQLITELKQATQLINAELMEILREIIRKLCLSLIQREIQADPQLLAQCVESLANFLPYKNGLITVYVSAEDQAGMEKLDDKAIIVQVNPELKPGDILIQSNGSEIRALLSERIDMLLRESHDKQ